MKLLRLAMLATLLFSFNQAGAATLTESPANIAQGNTVLATWTTIANPTPTDWIGLYLVGAGDGSFRDWVYVSCSRSPGVSRANGTCNFPILASQPNGTYELRLFSNDGFNRLAVSTPPFNVAPIPPARFVDNNDGTISDTQTGLMWEKKSGAVGTFVNCSTPTTCPDPHSVNNVYVWSSTGTIPDGPLFTDFLTKINRADGASSNGLSQDRKNYSDWRIPTIAELRGILLAPFPCGTNPCIDPIFGPAAAGFYWSSTTFASDSFSAWIVNFVSGEVDFDGKDVIFSARAVRGGR